MITRLMLLWCSAGAPTTTTTLLPHLRQMRGSQPSRAITDHPGTRPTQGRARERAGGIPFGSASREA